MYDTSEDEIDKCFTDLEEKPLVHNSTPMKEGNYGGMVYDECMCKAGNYIGNLVVFPKKKDMTMRNVSHEAFHVLSSMNDACDLERFRGALTSIQGTLSSISCAKTRWMATKPRPRSALRTYARQCFTFRTK